MSVFYSDDPVRDFERWDAEQSEWLEKLPKCAHCDHAIQDERLMSIDGELYHIDCAIEAFSEWTENHMEN